ncbi:MAG TPA: heavy metal translocating P-type ATPase [Burkholderiaceae bacterium]|nr:heavy metal translocating P-type ATPase [Burkholderiaceae bacterium]
MSSVLIDDVQGAAAHSAAMADCFHCGLPVPPSAHWVVAIDAVERPMCCPGCQAVAQAIVDNGLTDYYRNRTVFSGTADKDGLIPPELQLYDTPEGMHQFAAAVAEDATSCETTLSIDGIRCAACVWLIERHLARVPGVQAANMNVATERLYIRWATNRCKPSDLLRAVREIGYLAYPFDAVKHGEQLRRAGKILFRQLFVAGLSMMQVMMYAVPAYLTNEGPIEADMAALMQWASLLLTIPAVFYSALPFFKGAWVNMKNRAPGMDVPVALGIAAAFGASVVATWRGQGEVYFDSVTMFIFLLLCSRYFELLARRKAAASLEKLQYALPASASRMPAYPASHATEIVPAAQLQEDDIILVKPGEAIAADGMIIDGETSIDLSLLTGESRPTRKAPGDMLPGGAVNATQAVIMRVSKSARDSTLSALIKLIERAGQAKPQLALWADQVAAWFVTALLLFALVVFGLWEWLDPSRAWPIAIAVLVVSCPCALSLATPTALAAATDRMVRQGILIVQPHVLETLHRMTHIVFDKTGTLTLGKPKVQAIEIFGVTDRQSCLRIAAALEASNAHPLGMAIVQAAAEAQIVPPAVAPAGEVFYQVGQGLEGRLDGTHYRLGSAAFVAGIADNLTMELPNDGLTPVYLGADHAWLARFDMADPVRDDARRVIQWFKSAGKTVILLSGDQHAITQRVAEELGIDAAYGEYLPDQKLAFVQNLQRDGAVVAMVGDGMNDAAVLRVADVSFAMGAGAALAQAHADTVLLSGKLMSIVEAADAASQTMSVIRQNLAWAVIYNALAIPAAASGYLNPWLSGIGMSLSSAIVVANALRLRRISRKRFLKLDDSAMAGKAPYLS